MQELKKAPTTGEGPRATNQPTRQLTICVNNSGSIESTALEAVTGTWADIAPKILKPHTVSITRAEYLALHEGDRDQKQKAARIKAQAGYFLCGTCDPLKRAEGNVKAHSLLPLDIDGITPAEWETVRQKLEALGASYLWYPTASDTKGSRRIRVIVPLAKDIEHTPGTGKKSAFADYVKRLAAFLGVSTDAAACNPAQAMYRPTAFQPPADADPKAGVDMSECAARIDRPLLDADSLPPLVQADPTPPPTKATKVAPGKPGAPGISHGQELKNWFNTHYPGGDVIDAFLSDVYERASSDRWTYVDGETAGGLKLLEGGLFYSHHSTDPANTGHSKTPFQLVCSHRFGDGKEAYKACCDWVQTLPGAPQPPADSGADSGVFPASGSEVGWHEKAPQKAPQWQFRTLDTVTTATTHWLVKDWIPEGFVTLFTGREGIGKSTLVVDIAARFTRGELDGQTPESPRKVLYVASEDDYSRVLSPRLKAAKAEVSNVLYLDGGDGGAYVPKFPRDLGILEEAITSQTCGLIVIDALLSCMPDGANTNDQKQVREFLEPLVRFASRHGVTVIGVTHQSSKKRTTDSGAGMVGSSALSQTVRSVITCAEDSDTGHLVAGVTKTNLAPKGESIAYRLESVEIPLDDGQTGCFPCAVLIGPSEKPVTACMVQDYKPAEKGSRDDLEQLILDMLAEGEKPRSELLEAAVANGHSERTFKRVLSDLRNEKGGGVMSENSPVPGQPRRTIYRLACGDPLLGVGQSEAL